MRRWLGFIALSVLGLFSGLAVADYTVKDASSVTQTVFGFVCFTTKICPAHVLVTSAGVEISPSTAALQTTINTTLGTPFQAGGSIGNTTFASTQSGTWTVQPGNTANTTPWLFQGNVSNAADGVATGSIQSPTLAYNMGFNGTTWDRMRVDGGKNLVTSLGTIATTLTGWTSGTALNNTQTLMTTANGAPAILLQLNQTSTLTVGAMTIEGTYDGTNWVTIPVAQVLNPNTLANLTNPYTLVASTNQPFLILTQGYQGVRIKLSTQITGSATVTPFVTLLNYNPTISGILNPLTAGTANIGTIGNTQASTTSGQFGPLVQCAVTTGAPTYTTAQTDPCSLTTLGSMRVDNATVLGVATPVGSGVMATAPRVALATDSPGIVTLGQTTKSASVPMTIASDQVGTAGTANATVTTVQGIASMTPIIANATNGYPTGAIAETASATGTTAATTATLATAGGKTTYICGFSIRANATAAATGTATVTGTITATMSFVQWTAPLASGIGLVEQQFTPCVPASATNTSIAVVSAAPGSGGTVSVAAWGFQL